ncbi:cytochrome c oxidase subunit 1, partial [Nowakowskiella sp. JEL0078]
LQQFFNQFIFKLEQEEYDKEGIEWTRIDFKDNQICVDLIEGKPFGILSLLDEETKFPKGTDISWLQKLHSSFAKQTYYVKPRMANNSFGIKHYAGEVQYNVDGFLEKNKDSIQEEFIELIQNSSVPFLSKLFPKQVDDKKGNNLSSAKGSGKVTASGYFKGQLTTLVSTLALTQPHYVRCIKPNDTKKAFVFDDSYLVNQLRYSGMLETIRIRKAGFTIRLKFDSFNRSFNVLIPSGKTLKDNPQQLTVSLMENVQNLKKDDWQIGKTKIFFKSDSYAVVQNQSDLKLKKIIPILVCAMKSNACRQKFIKTKRAAKVLQKFVKRFVARKKFLKIKKSAIKIQSGCFLEVVRGWFARDKFRILKGEESHRKKIKTMELDNKKQPVVKEVIATKGHLDGLFSFLEEFDEVEFEELDEIDELAEILFDEIDEMINPGESKKKRKKKIKKFKKIAKSDINLNVKPMEIDENSLLEMESSGVEDEMYHQEEVVRNVEKAQTLQQMNNFKSMNSVEIEQKINPNLPELSMKYYAQRNFK